MRSAPALPLSLLHSATFISKDYKVIIFDARVEKNWKKRIKSELTKDVLFFGVTAYTGPMISSALEASKFVKENSSIPVVWGGIHASLVPEQTLSNEYIDMVVVGEGEIPLLMLSKALEAEINEFNITGLLYKNNDGLIRGNSEIELLDLNTIPEVPYHLIDVSKFLPLYNGRPSFYFQTSRGCPFSCSYCYNTAFNKSKWRCLSVKNTLDRISIIIEKYAPKDIYFVDDNFFVDLERGKEILEGLKKFDVSWQTQGVDISTLKKMDNQYFQLIKDSNCSRITIGVESGSSTTRKLMNKQGTPEEIIDVIRKLSSYNIIIFCSFMCGFQSESLDDIRATVSLIFKLQSINPNVRISPIYIYTPYPGTKMFNEAIESGYTPPKELRKWAEYSYENVNIYPKQYKMKKLYESLSFTTLFIDNKVSEYCKSRLLKAIVGIYRPIAKFRTENLFFLFLIEKIFFELIKKLLYGEKL